MELILFLAGLFLATFIVGRLLEKVRIPWIFGALILGLGLAAYNPFQEITSTSSFSFLASLGMYFLLFIIGFELNIKKMFQSRNFVIKTTFAIILAETVVGAVMIHYIFGTPWVIAALVATSFATVGEAMLLPILDEFKLIKTKLGQTIISVGVLDDVIEIITIIFASILVGRSVGHAEVHIWINLAVLLALFIVLFTVIKFRDEITSFKFKDINSMFLFVLFVMFAFIGIGMFAESAALGALLAGIALKNMIPKKRLRFIESEIKTMAYGFFAPVFFLWVGLETDVGYLIKYPLLIIAIILMTNITKIGTTYIMARKFLGSKESIIAGLSFCVKFSTSIVIIKFLFEKGLIQSHLYSVLIGTTIMFKFIIPFAMAYLIKRWHITGAKGVN